MNEKWGLVRYKVSVASQVRAEIQQEEGRAKENGEREKETEGRGGG